MNLQTIFTAAKSTALLFVSAFFLAGFIGVISSDGSRSIAYHFAFGCGYFIGRYAWATLIGCMLIVGIWMYVVETKIRNRQSLPSNSDAP